MKCKSLPRRWGIMKWNHYPEVENNEVTTQEGGE